MQKVFKEANSLDKRCYDTYFLSEDILMEHAAFGIYQHIEQKYIQNSSILVVCGSGNNGADGITLARLLCKKYNVVCCCVKQVKSDIGQLQYKRAKAVGVKFIETKDIDTQYDVLVDCLFGSGLNRELDETSKNTITKLNTIDGYKIACDIPSGVQNNGVVESIAFKADITLTMGALKESLFLDMTKDYVGRLEVIDLGVNRELYEEESNCYMLDMEDIQLPFRTLQNTHKGSFGHLAILSGEKEGASLLSAMAGFHLGAGLVSLVTHEKIITEPYLMQSHFIPKNTTAIAMGMGLGKYDKDEIRSILHNNIPKVIDADLFYHDDILCCLDQDNLILTPHPKEFCALLKLCGLDDIDIEILQKNRFTYLRKFTKKYPKIVVLLKGAHTLIASGQKIYINPHGTSALSFGGSGDVLAGFIGSLLAQGYEPLKAAIHGSLIHTLVAQKSHKNNYALTPIDLIEGVSLL